ncbi:MAG TPA: CHAT domain-containing tetratricopeptide repeat protein [Stellaceae bacterium]|nr:CHAT domain-containing tetratricopeptide repeat protein [Stellaceae bacterium]
MTRPLALALAFCAVLVLAAGPAAAQQRKQALGEAKNAEEQGQAEIAQGHYAAAEGLLKHALELREAQLGPDAPPVAQTLSQLGRVYIFEARPDQAEPVITRSLAIREKALGPDAPPVAQSLTELAAVYRNESRYFDAEPLYTRALAILEKAYGPDDPRLANTIASFAQLYRLEGFYGKAEPLVQRALALIGKTPNAKLDADMMRTAAALDLSLGHYADAEKLDKDALALNIKERGPDHPAVANSLNSLASVYLAEGHFAQAEPLLQQGLAIREKALGPDHPAVAETVDNLAIVYRTEGRYGDAEALAKRALAIREKVVGPDHPSVASSLNSLAVIYVMERHFAQAVPLYERALAIREKSLGKEHRLVAATLYNLAMLQRARGADAKKYEPLLERVLAIEETALGPTHPETARTLSALGAAQRDIGKRADAEKTLKRALDIEQGALGTAHPLLTQTLDDLALCYEADGNVAGALEASNRAVEILLQHFTSEASGKIASASDVERQHRLPFLLNISLAEANAAKTPDRRGDMVKSTFRTAQYAQSSDAAEALAGMAARFASGTDALATLIREQQDAVQQWKTLDSAMIDTLGKAGDARNQEAEKDLRAGLDRAAQRVRALDQQIAHDFPGYAELSNPQPSSLEAVQSLLGPDEALLVYVVALKQSWLWAVRQHGAEIYDIALNAKDLTAAVKSLRANLDPVVNLDFRPYPAKEAFALYEKILAPAAPFLAGVHHVMIVPDGALESLPFGVLVTKAPAADPRELADHRELAWLARDYAIIVLPGVSSLKALRQVAVRSKASLPFVGIGDPLLKGGAGATRGVANLADLFKGGLADPDKLRELPRLPETADEIRSVAAALGAPSADLFLEDRASEPLLRSADLGKFRIIEFATHGLMSGDISGLAEPALVLTPPAAPSADNDGLLTSSKIARLKLDADWVVLSACNTAAGDGTPGAQGLSGLAKAFFYAGSRAILVSNWSIASKAAVKLTTGAFAALAKEPAIGRAEALRRSELALLDDKTLPAAFAHPSIWGPFTLAGEGGAGR